MHAALSVLSFATLASVASAQLLAPVGQGYGRFPCDPNSEFVWPRAPPLLSRLAERRGVCVSGVH